MTQETLRFNKEMIIGDVIKMHPGAEAIIKRDFGNGCFTCPGMTMESLSFGAMMHNMDADAIVDELNQLE